MEIGGRKINGADVDPIAGKIHLIVPKYTRTLPGRNVKNGV